MSIVHQTNLTLRNTKQVASLLKRTCESNNRDCRLLWQNPPLWLQLLVQFGFNQMSSKFSMLKNSSKDEHPATIIADYRDEILPTFFLFFRISSLRLLLTNVREVGHAGVMKSRLTKITECCVKLSLTPSTSGIPKVLFLSQP